jgi:hypothetical protein
MAHFRNGAKWSINDASERVEMSLDTARQQIKCLHDAGLLRIGDYRKKHVGYPFPVYEWAEPFGQPDVQRPTKETHGIA